MAFVAIKDMFLKAPILMMPDSAKPFIVEANAFKWTMGAVFKQRDINKNWHSCGYMSNTSEIELLAGMIQFDSFSIQSAFGPCIWKMDGPIRCTIKVT
jgi:hypothetical protein